MEEEKLIEAIQTFHVCGRFPTGSAGIIEPGENAWKQVEHEVRELVDIKISDQIDVNFDKASAISRP